MSKTLSVLILENFVINEGPKWDRFKRGAKKVARGAVTAAALGSIALGGRAGYKMYDADRNYKSDMAISQADYEGKLEDLKEIRFNSHRTIAKRKDLTPGIKDHLRSEITREFYNQDGENRTRREDREKEITKTRDNQHTQGKQALAGAAGLAAVPLLAGANALGAKGEKKRQAKKSLKERLNLVKSGMFLNEEDSDTTVLEKERESDGHTPESIATLHNVPVQDILDQIEKGIKVEREHTTDKAEARLIAMDHLVELPDYYTRLDKMEEEGKMENSINESEKKQERKSLKERLELVKSELFLEEELLNEGIIKKALGTLGTLALGASMLNTGANLKDRHDWKSHAENTSHQEVMKTDDWLNRTENIDRKDDDDYKEKERQLQVAKDRQEAFKKAKKNPFQKSVTYGDKVTEGRNDRPFTQKVGDLARKITGK